MTTDAAAHKDKKTGEESPVCPYCQRDAQLISGAELYPHRRDLERLTWKNFWRCEPCNAWVGCHEGTTRPLGRLADKALRKAKQEAHDAFDPLWKAKSIRERIAKHRARRQAYEWLAGQLGIHPDDCHIGMFDEATCRRVVEICKPISDRIRSIA